MISFRVGKKNRAKYECLSGAESSLRLLAGTLFPQAPEYLRFDSWPRHWAIGLKTGQILYFLFL
ncbi:hypothetical protein NBRC111894_168 [Sporolactobacillus inulinus]|uniref:Uncharacterized protein n=1 Tax=Sporolactobacillus inulinus TaxID=2078 RepID=A0A4Y1Z6H8_9BACL|nr:hypothetical protein NBRC111894_168 [Sporolactobacillus inulinus]